MASALALLLFGLALEGLLVRRASLQVRIATAARAYLGQSQPAAFAFENGAARPLTLEYAPAVPAGFDGDAQVRRVTRTRHAARRAIRSTLLPVRLGPQRWPALPARLLGPLGLAWWSATLQPARAAAGGARYAAYARAAARPGAAAPRRGAWSGAGAELHQLRAYVRGDPLARIDWKATARSRRTGDARVQRGPASGYSGRDRRRPLQRRARGRLDRFGLYANLRRGLRRSSRTNDDRIGLVVYADRPLAVCAPARGLRGGYAPAAHARAADVQRRRVRSDCARQ